MNKLHHTNMSKENKFGTYNHHHHVETVKRHQHFEHLCMQLAQNAQWKTVMMEMAKVNKDEPVSEAEAEPALDFTTIYERTAEEVIQPTERTTISSTMPKMRAIVELAVSKAKLDAIIKKKKW